MATAVRPERPGVVTLIGVVIYIQAFLAVIAGIATIVYRDDANVILQTGATPDELLAAGIVELIVAGLLALVASSVLAGANWSRWLVVVVEGFRMGTALWVMLHHHSGAFLWNGLIVIGIGFFVIWALFGNERSDAYFRATP